MKKEKKIRKALAAMLALLALLLPVSALAAPEAGQSFTCYGKDLNTEQYAEVLKLLGTDLSSDTLISVSIDDEKALLRGLVDESKMGSRSLSSARVTILENGSGISVSTHNISWVTGNMYASALSTAGVENAAVVVAAPVEVSGTAALAGIFKAYESATGSVLDEAAKAVAASELTTLGRLAETIGPKEAEELIAMLKQYIAENDLKDPEKAKEAIAMAEKQLGVTLTDAQREQVIGLLTNFDKMNLDPAKVAEQINSLGASFRKLQDVQQVTQGFFETVKNGFQGVMNWFTGLFGKK
ncbi:MAG: DUF1002 domain-containing protein [Christensenellaceae bacterium]|jgi:uncharacterized protein YpuA (DUF1002 family)|nr:DUF1002 domain-containing protein [Christensenellaceae bacterium]